MIIYLKKSVLFTIDPDKRFSREYNLPEGLWKEIWRRHKLLDYTLRDMCDFYEFKTGKPTSPKAISRWVWRSEVYSMAYPIMRDGVETVTSAFFKKYEWEVIKELTKNLKSSVRKKTKTIV